MPRESAQCKTEELPKGLHDKTASIQPIIQILFPVFALEYRKI